jgi:hypothetical protein
MSEAMFIAGAALVSVGVGLWNFPAALVVLGCLLLILSLYVKAGSTPRGDA